MPADTTYATKAEARAWLATMETDILGGRHVDPTSDRKTFGNYARRWLEARDSRPRTRDTYQSQLAHILEESETVELRKITPEDVRGWHGRQAKSKKHPNTVAKIYRLFRTMMDTAVDDGLLRVNPVHIKGAAVKQAAERPALDWDDVQKIASAIEPRFSAFVWVAATSGLRFGELTGLTRNNVNLEERTLRVDQALMFIRGEGPTLGPPKSTAAHRTVTIPSSAAEMLADHLDAFTLEEPHAFVFTSLKGSPLLNRYFAPSWKKALAKAELPSTTRFHDLRHLAGTSAATAGASLREIMSRMGHTSSDASLRYLKASERRDSEIADAIEQRMRGDLDQ